GENKRTVTLTLKSVSETVTVQRDRQLVGAERGSVTFGSALTREQIEALPDDPVELERVLREMAGGDAIIKVDSFEGGRLPDKSQIKAIHISRDQFAAENHSAGGISIDIVTQAGSGPFRMNGNYSFGDSALNGKSPLVPAKGASRNQNMNFGGSGTIIPNKLSVSLNGGFNRSFVQPNIYANTPTGLVSEASPVRSHNNGTNIYADVTYALTKDQTLRVYYNQFGDDGKNNGVGGYDLQDRAYSTKNRFKSIRGQEAGPLGYRFVTNTKFAINWSRSETESLSDAVTERVIEAFTIGGAQRKGGRRSRDFMVQSDLDYVRGMHTWRLGVLVNGGHYRSDDSSNYNGTYTFESLEAYAARTPRSYSRRVGDPLIEYSNTQAAIYLQDDIRVRKNLSFSPGLRYEVQTHVRDFWALGPRFGFTWSPFKAGKTSIRASAGVFYEWFGTGIYEQSLRVDGFRQQELSILNPSYPNPGAVGSLSIGNKYLINPALDLPRSVRFSGGVDQQIGTRARVSSTYSYTKIDRSFRGENLNAPVNGVRPNPGFNNVVNVLSDGQGRQHQVIASASWQFAAPTPALQRERFNIRRGGLNVSYFFQRARNNNEGPFQPPSTGDLTNEWGPAFGDIRHRVNVGLTTQALRNLSANLSFSGSSGQAYNITTGRDDNGDFYFNDRPSGLGRNAGRGDGQWTLNANFNYNMTFGKPAGSSGGGGISLPAGVPMIVMAGGMEGVRISTPAGAPAQGPAQVPGRYRMSIFLRISNLTNHANPFGYSGAMTSKSFGLPTNYQGVRQVNLGLNFGF
ncbi:MAG TPA: hypothetical protein VMZ90_01845, partial [Vicinamibacterales bacterium]|nr:hypothetical protein [Vicinamibacterales bacterium]